MCRTIELVSTRTKLTVQNTTTDNQGMKNWWRGRVTSGGVDHFIKASAKCLRKIVNLQCAVINNSLNILSNQYYIHIHSWKHKLDISYLILFGYVRNKRRQVTKLSMILIKTKALFHVLTHKSKFPLSSLILQNATEPAFQTGSRSLLQRKGALSRKDIFVKTVNG